MTNERMLRRPTGSRQPGSPSEAPDFDRIAADLHAAVISDSLDSLGNLNHALGPNLLPIDPTAKVIGRAATMQLVEDSIEPERHTGDLIFGDRDGVVVIPAELEVETIARAYEKVGKEGSARSALSGGALLKNVWDKYRVL